MNLLSQITFTVLTALADKLELCLRDYKHGGFLPPEKRAIALHHQKRAAHLARFAARLKPLDQLPVLRDRLLLYAQVLSNEYPAVSQTRLSAKPIRKG